MMQEDGNTANDLIVETEEEEPKITQTNSMQETVKELSQTLFKKYPHKTSRLQFENIEGMVQADCLNEYMEKNFGRRYTVLDVLCNSLEERIVSENGKGIDAITELLKSIQATFEQHEIPEKMKGWFNK